MPGGGGGGAGGAGAAATSARRSQLCRQAANDRRAQKDTVAAGGSLPHLLFFFFFFPNSFYLFFPPPFSPAFSFFPVLVGGQLPVPVSCPPPPPCPGTELALAGPALRAVYPPPVSVLSRVCSPSPGVAAGGRERPPRPRTPSEMTFCVSAAAAPVRMPEEQLPGQAPTAGMRPEEKEED